MKIKMIITTLALAVVFAPQVGAAAVPDACLQQMVPGQLPGTTPQVQGVRQIQTFHL